MERLASERLSWSERLAHLASLLMRAGDIEPNPGPGPRYPCGTCGRGVGGASICCRDCGLWHHRRVWQTSA